MSQAALGGSQSLNASVLSHTLLMIVVQTENGSNYHCLMCVWLWCGEDTKSQNKANPAWILLCLGPLVSGSSCVWVLLCLGPLVSGSSRVWVLLCLGPLVSGSSCVWILLCLGPLVLLADKVQPSSACEVPAQLKVTQHPSGSSSVRGQVPVGAYEYFLELAECKPLQNNCQQPMFCNILLCCLCLLFRI